MFPLRSEFEPLKERHEEVEQSVSQLRKDNIEIVSRAEEHAKDVAKKLDVKAVRLEIEKFSKNLKMPEISLPTDSGEELLALKQMLEKFNAIEEQFNSVHRDMREMEDSTREQINDLKLNKWDHRKGRHLEEEFGKLRKELRDSHDDL